MTGAIRCTGLVTALVFSAFLVGCGSPKTSEEDTGTINQAVTDEMIVGIGRSKVTDPAQSAFHAMRQASAAHTPLLNTPSLPFFGNQTLLTSAVAGDGTTILVSALQRQSDCSLSAIVFPYNAPIASAASLSFIPGAQNTLHELSGLTTTPNLFAAGCADTLLGLTQASAIGVANTQVLGTTAGGATIVAAVDGDYNLKIIVANAAANTATAITLVNGSNANYLIAFAAADINGDGKIDLVATNVTDPNTSQPSTEILLGNGDGTFQPGVYFALAGAVTVDDFNGDGKADIAVLGSTGITVLIGAGNGNFSIGPVSTISGSGPLMTGDFNGDGKRDLLIGSNVFFGAGNGSFTAGPATSGISSLGIPGTEAVGDFNKDGRADVAVSSAGGSVGIFIGNGDGTFKPGVFYAGVSSTVQVNVTDVDGDGNPDLVLGTNGNGLYTAGRNMGVPMLHVLLGHGDGTFAGAPLYAGGGSGVAIADFLGNGHTGALTIQQTVTIPELALIQSDNSGQLGTPIASPFDNSVNSFFGSATFVGAADLSGDGKPDAIIAGAKLAVLINQGDGTFAAEQDYTLPARAVSLATGDFNGDGHIDVAVGVAPPNGQAGTSGVFVFFGQANGTLSAPLQVDSASTSVTPTALAVGDINGDGRADLVVGDEGTGPTRSIGLLHVYLGNANGSFTTVTAPATTATFYTVAALGDVNGDGKLDLVVAGTVGHTIGALTPNVYTLLGNGDGTFRAATAQALGSQDGIGATSIALADFNQNGHLDVAVGTPNDYTELLFGDGTGTYTIAALALGQQPTALTAADLDGNGFPDLLIGNAAGLAIFKNTAAWTVTAAAGDFSMTPTSTAGTVAAGHSVQTTIALTPSGGFAANVSLSCSGLPAGASCEFAPSTVSISGSTASSNLTITTSASATRKQTTAIVKSSDPTLPGGLLLATIGIPWARRRRDFLSKADRCGLLAILLIGSAVSMNGCGGSSSGGDSSAATATSAGNYAITVAATGGSQTHSFTYTLTIN